MGLGRLLGSSTSCEVEWLLNGNFLSVQCHPEFDYESAVRVDCIPLFCKPFKLLIAIARGKGWQGKSRSILISATGARAESSFITVSLVAFESVLGLHSVTLLFCVRSAVRLIF